MPHRNGLRSLRAIAFRAAVVAAGLLGVTATGKAELASAMRVASLDLAGTMGGASEAPGKQLIARVDISEQKMQVFLGGELIHEFAVSTGRKGYATPVGRYQVQWTHPKWYSRTYDMAPMPHSVFFHGGYAVHATSAVKRLGRPASHGCVRLAPKNAKIFYQLVRATGNENTLVSIVR